MLNLNNYIFIPYTNTVVDAKVKREKRANGIYALTREDKTIGLLFDRRIFSEENAKIFSLYNLNKMNIQDLIARVVNKENLKTEEYLLLGQELSLNIVKNSGKLKALDEKGFTVATDNFSFKEVITKSFSDVEPSETTEHVITAVFTSNTGDVQNDVISEEAINKAIFNLNNQSEVLPIYKDHNPSDSYGAWRRFWIEKKDGVTYGLAEGVLFMDRARSQDLWKDLQSGKKFGVSLGGKAIDSDYENVGTDRIRVIKGVRLDEISIVPRPANTKAILDAIQKHEDDRLKQIDVNLVIEKVMEIQKQEQGVAEEVIAPVEEAAQVEAAPVEVVEVAEAPAVETVEAAEVSVQEAEAAPVAESEAPVEQATQPQEENTVEVEEVKTEAPTPQEEVVEPAPTAEKSVDLAMVEDLKKSNISLQAEIQKQANENSKLVNLMEAIFGEMKSMREEINVVKARPLNGMAKNERNPYIQKSQSYNNI